MDSKPQRRISDIRPVRSMDGVTPVGNRRPSQPTVAAPPVRREAAPLVDGSALEQVANNIPQPAPVVERVEPVAPTRPAKLVAPKLAEPAATQEKKKRGLVKTIVKIVVGLVVLGLVTAGGWMVYVNYFR